MLAGYMYILAMAKYLLTGVIKSLSTPCMSLCMKYCTLVGCCLATKPLNLNKKYKVEMGGGVIGVARGNIQQMSFWAHAALSGDVTILCQS